jgi:hypothetical protein
VPIARTIVLPVKTPKMAVAMDLVPGAAASSMNELYREMASSLKRCIDLSSTGREVGVTRGKHRKWVQRRFRHCGFDPAILRPGGGELNASELTGQSKSRPMVQYGINMEKWLEK